jgi:hypothetical protein
VKREGNMYFTQSYLKPQFLVTQTLNHTITDIYSKPNTIEWVLVDGNFPSASGRWEISESRKGLLYSWTPALEHRRLSRPEQGVCSAYPTEISFEKLSTDFPHGWWHKRPHGWYHQREKIRHYYKLQN